ncbi:Transcriptional regulatory protein FixJ [Sterolibacterium denitrificans]|uniref:Transcriptional regulatory protein FixJ n=1 Tax=Sterolibacterium denitrificans TaxID=157592 RepID=A0A7Z7HP48_9PROT|nr:response regulator [Sterolibacterium denitrificans]SMB21797.1 Transcriptional regulatory protein FixJ [Sterolibacterium denitrificans]
MNNTVFIVDDDAAVRDSLSLLLSLHGYRTTVFADAASLLGALQADWQGCLIIDIRMPGMDGLALQRELQARGCALPIIIITGHGDVASAREAFRAAAVDFLEKPLDEARLLQAIEESFSRQSASAAARQTQEQFSRRLKNLTPREQEVMEQVIAGRHNREIAALLGISVRTVEVHKARMMAKLDADNIPQLVRISLGADDAAS